MPYQHLTYKQRCELAALRKAGYFQKDIAKELGVSPSTISREINRNKRWNDVYCPDQANATYQSRRNDSKKRGKFTDEVKAQVREKLLLDWSPEQISGYAKKESLFSISHERIYQYVLEDKSAGGKLFLHLRRGKKKYRKRYGSCSRTSPIKNRVMIDERPKIVDEKTRLGDWEIDTIIGKQHQKAIVTLVERVSKKTIIGKVGTKRAEFVSAQVIELLTPLKPYVQTITADNGSEFAAHEGIAKALEANIYFAHPYHSWERGLNENTNGLIRQYIPKGTDFSALTDTDIQNIETSLNTRPRKALGYATPDEIFNQMKQQAV